MKKYSFPKHLGCAMLLSGLFVLPTHALPTPNNSPTPRTNDVAQTRKVSGTVHDEAGEPIIGATITVEGKSTGAISDINGRFTVEAPAGATLIISYVGYVTKEVPANALQLDITLQEDTKLMNEVVVIGYGTMKKKDLTGSISQIKPDKLQNEAPATVQDVLRGTAGINVGFSNTAKGGGSLSVRGQRSVYTSGSHNDPLIILDGMIFYGELSEINPADIEQIDILKDASSAAVYGAKSANGVVLVTTKKGRTGKPKIGFSANIGINTVGNSRKVYDPEGYLQYRTDFYKSDTYGLNSETGAYEAYQNGKVKAGYYDEPTTANLQKYGLTLDEWRAMSTNSADATDREIWGRRLGLAASSVTLQNFINGTTFDWYDQAFQNGVNQNYDVNVSGATDYVNYYLSLGYQSNNGIIRGNEYDAIRSNLKLNANVTKWLSVGANINFQNRTDGDVQCDWDEELRDNSPFVTPYDADGNLTAHPMGEDAYWKGYNYDFNKLYIDRSSGYTVLNTILNAKLTLPYGISYNLNFAPRYQYYHLRRYNSSEHPDWQSTNYDRVTRQQSKRFDWSLNNTITWDYTFNKLHHFILTLVQEAEERQSWTDLIIARNILPSEALSYHATANGDKNQSEFSSTDNKETACGYLARLFYAYNDTYMATVSMRRDGYSAFGTTNPYANFFSAALAWTFTNEKFWTWEPLSLGKLRFSFGQNGNRSLADTYIALANLSLGSYATGYINAASSALTDTKYLFMNRLANTHLQWEKTSSWNIGLDLGFLDNRITASFDAYYMPTTDMIMNQSLPDFAGFSSITTNLGKVVNKGFEITINSNNIVRKNFSWNTSLAFSYNKNEIKELYGEYETVLNADGTYTTKEVDDISNGWFVGHPISAIWDYEVTGIWQSDQVEEAARYGQRPGDPIVANHYTADKVAADGTTTPVYNNKDKEFLGQTTPPIHWSLRNTFNIYNDWTFSFNLYSYMGHKSLSTEYINNDNNYSQITNGRNVYEKEYWTPENPTNKYARLNAQGPTGISAPGKAIDRSFIRLENISLAYQVPRKYLSPLRIESCKVIATVRNVACWTKEWTYGDPEASGGLVPRTYTLGINITL